MSRAEDGQGDGSTQSDNLGPPPPGLMRGVWVPSTRIVHVPSATPFATGTAVASAPTPTLAAAHMSHGDDQDAIAELECKIKNATDEDAGLVIQINHARHLSAKADETRKKAEEDHILMKEDEQLLVRSQSALRDRLVEYRTNLRMARARTTAAQTVKDAANRASPPESNPQPSHSFSREQLLAFRLTPEQLHPEQIEAMKAIDSGKHTVVQAECGSGKSLTYMLPAAVRDTGTTVVFQPLLSLITDQVAKARGHGIKTAVFTDEMSEDQVDTMIEELEAGEYRLLFLTPEKLARNSRLQRVIKRMLSNRLIHGGVFDEANTLSEWEFFRKYLEFIGKNRRDYFGDLAFLALTGSSTESMRELIITALRLDGATVIVGTTIVPVNMRITVKHVADVKEAMQKALEIVKAFPDEKSICFAFSKRECEIFKELAVSAGVKVDMYHSDMPADQQNASLESWLSPTGRLMVATESMSMGVDCSGVVCSIQITPPKSMSSFLQKCGRTARRGEIGFATAFYSHHDRVRMYAANIRGAKSEDELRKGKARLTEVAHFMDNAVDQVCITAWLERLFLGGISTEGVNRNGLKCRCGVCARPHRRMDASLIAARALTIVPVLIRRTELALVDQLARDTQLKELARANGITKSSEVKALMFTVVRRLVNDKILTVSIVVPEPGSPRTPYASIELEDGHDEVVEPLMINIKGVDHTPPQVCLPSAASAAKIVPMVWSAPTRSLSTSSEPHAATAGRAGAALVSPRDGKRKRVERVEPPPPPINDDEEPYDPDCEI